MTTYANEELALTPLPKSVQLAPLRESWLLEMLPAVFANDDFLKRFLFIFEDTLKPLMGMVDNFHYYFHPLTAPPEMLAWLSSWVNLVLDDNWPLEQRRQLIHSAADLYSRRGTRRGLAEYLQLYIGVEPEVSEYVDGMTLGAETFLGINTTIAGRERHCFTVTLQLPGLTDEEIGYKELTIRRIIEAEKPAHTSYRLRILTDDDPDGTKRSQRISGSNEGDDLVHKAEEPRPTSNGGSAHRSGKISQKGETTEPETREA